MLATFTVCEYRANKGTGIKLHQILLLGQRDPLCMVECLSIHRDNHRDNSSMGTILPTINTKEYIVDTTFYELFIVGITQSYLRLHNGHMTNTTTHLISHLIYIIHIYTNTTTYLIWLFGHAFPLHRAPYYNSSLECSNKSRSSLPIPDVT